MSKIVDFPYERYPREFIDPTSVELSIGSLDNSELFVVSPTIKFVDSNESLLLYTINLFLEIFGTAHILTKDLNKINVPITRRLNWTILPEGEYPREEIQPLVKPILDKAKEGNRTVYSTDTMLFQVSTQTLWQ